MTFYEDFFRSLEKRKIKYLVVGGLAVILHGFVRATADLDLILSLDEENLRKFLSFAKKKGYKPKAPVRLEDFVDKKNRISWLKKKGMLVFSLYHPQSPQELIDIFINEPIPFKEAFERKKVFKIGKTPINVIGVRDLIHLKKQANRLQDKEDIKALRSLAKINNEK